MHAPSLYEIYLLNERSKYFKQDKEMPMWLELEFETYYWIFDLSRKMYSILESRTVSKQMLERIVAIQTIRFRRYRDISPALKTAVNKIADEFALLNKDLKDPEMWRRQCLLTTKGFERWKEVAKIVSDCIYVVPDAEWRERWMEEVYQEAYEAYKDRLSMPPCVRILSEEEIEQLKAEGRI